MSIVTYKIGAKDYSFESCLQIEGMESIAVEENLHEAVRTDIQKRKDIIPLPPRDIILVDDNGNKAVVKDFSEIGNIHIYKS